MPTDREPLGELVLEIAAAAARAGSLDALVVELARAFGESLSLWRASVCTFDQTHAHVLASWSAVEPILADGTMIQLDLAPDTRTIVQHVAAGRLVVFDVTDLQLGILDDVLREEGIEASVVIPLRDGQTVFGFVWLGSYVPGIFDLVDPSIFRGLGAAVERRAGQLLRADT